MTIAYDILFRVQLQHEYYDSGLSGDFEFAPTPSTLQLLNDRGYIFRAIDHGFIILARVEPQTSPPVLFRSIGDDLLRFAFQMKLRNTYFHNITDLPDYATGEEVFYFSNLHNAVLAGNPRLGDQVASADLGAGISLIRDYTQNIIFGKPLQTATIELKDIFGNLKTPIPQLALSGTDETADFQIDLKKPEKLPPGRYVTEWTGTGSAGADSGSAPFYFEPGLVLDNTLGIIEIFNHTNAFLPGNNPVPGTHTFLNGNTLERSGGQNELLKANYQIRFSAHPPVRWHYLFTKKSTQTDPVVNLLSISDFTETNASEHVPLEVDRVLRSDNDIEVRETTTIAPPTLSSNLTNFNPVLPQPAMGSNLKRISGQAPFYELYVYV